MQRIDERTVKLTTNELIANEFFNDQLDRGKNIPDSVALVRLLMGNTLSEEFYDYIGK